MDTLAKRKRKEDLLRELRKLDSDIEYSEKNCSHDWDKSTYDPESIRVPSGYELEKHGSDCWSVPTGYRTESKPRWKRVCKKCGKTEYTYTQKPSHYEPDFK